ncbi:MAG TPA: hypothetical protein VL985_11800 [Stellaceae bacterium]|nr:hypothetical protein [Stellaceae bacterium]
MIKKLLFVAIAWLAASPALAQTQTLTIGVAGKSTVVNTAPYGTVVDALMASNSSGTRVQGVTWTISNPDFYIDALGDLHTAWSSIIAPGPQTMTITAAASGYTTAALSLTVTVTGTMAPQTMLITPVQVATAYDNSPRGTIVYSLTVSQPNGTLGNLSSGVTWTVDNPLFAVVDTTTDAGIYYLTTTWTGQIAPGSQMVNLTASAPGYTTATLSLTIGVVAAANPTITIAVNGASSVPDNVVSGTVVDTLTATNSSGTAVPGVTFSVNNPNFTVSGGNLTTTWTSPISEGSQTMTITASAPGFTTATLPLTVTVTAPCQ